MTAFWIAILPMLAVQAPAPSAEAAINAARGRLESSSEDERERGMADMVELAYLVSVGARTADPGTAKKLLAEVAEHLSGVSAARRAKVIVLLKFVDDEAALDLLVATLTDPAPIVRREAAEGLLTCARRYGLEPTPPAQFYAPVVLEASADEDPAVRQMVRCVLRLALHWMEDPDQPRPGPLRNRLRSLVGVMPLDDCGE